MGNSCTTETKGAKIFQEVLPQIRISIQNIRLLKQHLAALETEHLLSQVIAEMQQLQMSLAKIQERSYSWSFKKALVSLGFQGNTRVKLIHSILEQVANYGKRLFELQHPKIQHSSGPDTLTTLTVSLPSRADRLRFAERGLLTPSVIFHDTDLLVAPRCHLQPGKLCSPPLMLQFAALLPQLAVLSIEGAQLGLTGSPELFQQLGDAICKAAFKRLTFINSPLLSIDDVIFLFEVKRQRQQDFYLSINGEVIGEAQIRQYEERSEIVKAYFL